MLARPFFDFRYHNPDQGYFYFPLDYYTVENQTNMALDRDRKEENFEMKQSPQPELPSYCGCKRFSLFTLYMAFILLVLIILYFLCKKK
jgi:hypothetical protein